MTASSHRAIKLASGRRGRRQIIRSLAQMLLAATGLFYHDQDHCRALQPLLSGKLPRADCHHLRLCRRLDAVLLDGRAATRRVDEATSGRAPGGLALLDRQTGGQGSLGRKRVSADACCSAFFEISALWPACQTRETAYALSSVLSIVPLAVFSKAMSSIACLNKCLEDGSPARAFCSTSIPDVPGSWVDALIRELSEWCLLRAGPSLALAPCYGSDHRNCPGVMPRIWRK